MMKSKAYFVSCFSADENDVLVELLAECNVTSPTLSAEKVADESHALMKKTSTA